MAALTKPSVLVTYTLWTDSKALVSLEDHIYYEVLL